MKAKYIQFSGRAIAVLLLSGGLLCSGPAGLRAAELQAQTVQTEQMTVSGTIIDDSGLPVIGAGIFEKGTTNGTVTDIDGRFSITVNENAVLSISCVGYVTQEVKTGPGQTILDIDIKPVVRPYPQVSVHVLDQCPDEIVAKAGLVRRVMTEDAESGTIVSVQPVLRAEPHEAAAVFDDCVDCILRQPLAGVYALEIIRARGRLQRAQQQEEDRGTADSHVRSF